MTRLDEVALHGTSKWGPIGDTGFNSLIRTVTTTFITCRDGFSVSVIAGYGMYCNPRPGGFPYDPHSTSDTYEGPYTEVECGFPSVRPEPWAVWEPFCETPADPTGAVYSYVPVPIVRDLIELHGGETDHG